MSKVTFITITCIYRNVKHFDKTSTNKMNNDKFKFNQDMQFGLLILFDRMEKIGPILKSYKNTFFFFYGGVPIYFRETARDLHVLNLLKMKTTSLTKLISTSIRKDLNFSEQNTIKEAMDISIICHQHESQHNKK